MKRYSCERLVVATVIGDVKFWVLRIQEQDSQVLMEERLTREGVEETELDVCLGVLGVGMLSYPFSTPDTTVVGFKQVT